jgi:hypothetical protein
MGGVWMKIEEATESNAEDRILLQRCETGAPCLNSPRCRFIIGTNASPTTESKRDTTDQNEQK